MLRQISFRTALSAPRKVVAAGFSNSVLANTTRFLTTESAATIETINPPTLSAQKPATSTRAPRQLTYNVGRTASNNVSVYNDKRSGGTRKETTIKKIQGNAQDLKKDLINELQFKKDDVNVNPVTGHVKIKVRCNGTDLVDVMWTVVGTCANFVLGMAFGTSEDVARSSWVLSDEDIEGTKRCVESSTQFDHITKLLLNWPRAIGVPAKTARSCSGEWTDGSSLKGVEEKDIVQIARDQISRLMHSWTISTTAGRRATDGRAMYTQEERGMKLASVDSGDLCAFARLPRGRMMPSRC